LFVGLIGGCFGLLLGMGLFRHKTKHLKFTILVPLECVLWAVVAIHLASGLTLDRQIQYVETDYSSARVSEALDGYTIAFITDTHALPAEELKEVVTRLNEYAPDLLLLGGDFPEQADAVERSMDILSGVQTTDGSYGVEGNHDDYRELFAAMERHGITPLSNSGAAVREGLYLAGVEDIRNRTPDIAKATENAKSDDFVVLGAHNPDITMMQDTGNVDLVFSGHTHGGNITFFGVLAPILAWSDAVTGYGQRFMSGWATTRGGADIFVSHGTGYLAHVPRIFARPQVILVRLVAGE
jgi:predicted MPP superfamily phosphohydrolase